MTQFPDLFAALSAPFETNEVRSRAQAGRQVQYVTARVCMNRLDSVLGPENWWDEYVPAENSVLCRLTVRLPDGSTLTKADAGGYAGMPDQGDDDKSGFSDAFKRAAVKFGVGRYLYRDGVPSFSAAKETPPTPLPSPAPVSSKSIPETSVAPAPENGHGEKRRNAWGDGKPRPTIPANPKVPSSGRALFAWTKEQEQRHEVGLLKYLNSWAKLNELPGRMVDWDADQVSQGFAEAVRKLESIAHGQGEAHEEPGE